MLIAGRWIRVSAYNDTATVSLTITLHDTPWTRQLRNVGSDPPQAREFLRRRRKPTVQPSNLLITLVLSGLLWAALVWVVF